MDQGAILRVLGRCLQKPVRCEHLQMEKPSLAHSPCDTQQALEGPLLESVSGGSSNSLQSFSHLRSENEVGSRGCLAAAGKQFLDLVLWPPLGMRSLHQESVCSAFIVFICITHLSLVTAQGCLQNTVRSAVLGKERKGMGGRKSIKHNWGCTI